jgi:DHA3 family multidrug efflux protein-like MFS transporter
MNSDAGKEQFTWLLGTGNARGIAMVFLVAGIIAIIITVLAFRTKSYKLLSKSYADS